jgi:hypothetical protein
VIASSAAIQASAGHTGSLVGPPRVRARSASTVAGLGQGEQYVVERRTPQRDVRQVELGCRDACQRLGEHVRPVRNRQEHRAAVTVDATAPVFAALWGTTLITALVAVAASNNPARTRLAGPAVPASLARIALTAHNLPRAIAP